MNLPNKITTARLMLAAVLFVLLDLLGRGDPLPGWPLATLCFFLFIVVTASDALDGYYARKLGQQSDFGRIADPATDKVIVCGSLIFLSAIPWGRAIVPPWIVVAIVGREFIVTALRGYMETKGHAFGAVPAGKLKMIVQCIAAPAVIFTRILSETVGERSEVSVFFWWLAVVLIWATLVLTLWSGIGYVRKSWIHLRESGI